MRRRASPLSRTGWTSSVAIWLLLLSILSQAVQPSGAAMPRAAGSAFSPWTADVSLAPVRHALAEKQAQLRGRDDPAPGGTGADRQAALPVAVPAQLVAPAARPASPTWSGVPAGRLDRSAAPFAARAPPLSDPPRSSIV